MLCVCRGAYSTTLSRGHSVEGERSALSYKPAIVSIDADLGFQAIADQLNSILKRRSPASKIIAKTAET